jgi:nucleotide-binding universal stress UspA family protein
MVDTTWKRILVATDLGPMGNHAIEYAHALADRLEAELHVLHVTRNSTDAAAMFGATGAFEAGNNNDQSQEWLRTILGESGTVRRIESLQVGADVAKKIRHYIRTQNIDLLVMATHGRIGVSRLLQGSVTEEVIRSADCPVLVLPQPRKEKDRKHPSAEPTGKSVSAAKK